MRVRNLSKMMGLFLAFAASCCYLRAQNDVAISVFGNFSGGSVDSPFRQYSGDAAGGMIEVRHTSHNLFGYDFSYGVNRADQSYYNPLPCPPNGACVLWDPVHAYAHQLTAGGTISVHRGRFRPFGLLGAGAIIFVPVGSESQTASAVKAAFVYGAGLDWDLRGRVGLRLQYRGSLYKAPGLSTEYQGTDQFTNASQPMVGVFYRFGAR